MKQKKKKELKKKEEKKSENNIKDCPVSSSMKKRLK
jgi:hypothetical protein